MQPVAYMSPPAGSPASLVVQGRGATYQPDSSGNYVVTDNQDILALVASGFTIITGQSAIMSMYPQALTGIAPSATINTLGAAVPFVLPAGASGVLPESIDIVLSGSFKGGEIITIQLNLTYSDLSTGTVTIAITNAQANAASRTISFTNSQIRAMYKSGLFLTAMTAQAKSNKASSTLTVEVDLVALAS